MGTDPALARPGRRHHALAGVGRPARRANGELWLDRHRRRTRPPARHRDVGRGGGPAVGLVRRRADGDRPRDLRTGSDRQDALDGRTSRP